MSFKDSRQRTLFGAEVVNSGVFVARQTHPTHEWCDDNAKANKTDASKGSYGICRVVNTFRSPSPDPKRSPKEPSPPPMIDTGRFLWSRVITLVVISLLTVEVSSVLAFDPAGPPPQKTMEWTCRFLGSGRMAAASFQDATIWEAADFLSTYIPTGYNVTYSVDDALDDTTRHISLNLKDPTFFEVVAEIARQSETDVLISPGQVTFKKRNTDKAAKPK